MKLLPTKISMLVTLGAASSALGWSMNRLWPKWFNQSPSVPWLSAYMLVLMAIALLGWALHVRVRINPEPGKSRLDPLLAARTVALAMASSRVGSISSGFYLGFVVGSIVDFDSPAGRQRVIVSAIASLAAAGLVIVALWLERMCQIPEPPQSTSSSSATSS